MILKKAILHIMDFNSDICVFSQRELNIADGSVNEFLNKHLHKIMLDSSKTEGRFYETSFVREQLINYKQNEIDFKDFSTAVGHYFYSFISKVDELEAIDFLTVEFTEESRNYMAFLILPNQIAYTHQVITGEGEVKNDIIRYYTLLPNVTQKISSYALVNIGSMVIGFADKKRTINDEEVYIIPDKFLGCEVGISEKKTMKTINTITNQVAENYGVNAAVAVTRAKASMMEKAEEGENFCPFDLGDEIFPENKEMSRDFKEKMAVANMPREVKIENEGVIKTTRSHKIKTDTGIEITIPTECLENSNYIEFINNPNGTISISLKNIGKIVNKV